MKAFLLSLLAASAMILISCKYDANSSDLGSLKGTSWVLEDLAGLGVIDTAESTLVIGGDNRVSGYGACNRWFSSYEFSNGKLRIHQIGATKRLCPPEMMDQEKRFFDALSKVREVRMDEHGRLLIYSESYEQPLVFRPKRQAG